MAVSIRWSGQWARITPPVAPRARMAWRRMATIATDLVMVLIWAAMIPGFMWLGAAAGF